MFAAVLYLVAVCWLFCTFTVVRYLVKVYFISEQWWLRCVTW